MNLLRALAAVSSMTLLSRILGFVRDAIIARTFGAGMATDAFFVAFKLPNLLRRLFAEGAFSQAFVPILAEYKAKRGEDATRLLVARVATILFVVLTVVTALGVLGAPLIILVFAPGFTATPDKFELTVELTRIVFPYILFISLVSLAGGVLNTFSRFMVPAFTPVLLNVAMILAAAVAAPWFDPPILALGWGAFLGGILQLSLQIPALMRLGMLPRWDWAPRDEGMRRILTLMLPAALGVSVAQISLLINILFASFLDTGSVSWLYYADRLMEFPAGLLGAALGTILLPSLARHYADNDTGQYSKLLDWGLRMTLLLAAPAAVALGILAVPLIATLFFYGEFTAHDVQMTRLALVAYSVGLLGLILVKVLAPGFYARQNIKTPVKIALLTLLATQAMNLAFIWHLKHAGLALAIGLGACLNAGILYYKLRQFGIYQPQPGWRAFLGKLGLGLIAMGLFLWFAMTEEARWLAYGFSQRILHLGALVAGGILIYFATLGLLGFRPADFKRRAAE
ncbi:MAG: virulence factor [bacterium]|nr:MAG: virulence factor [bacterium]KAF0149083.1 MAG: virulence factor [bacterium]KAF0168425.1 MAG: virulence factor [bacterium]TXT20392.1 MAG: virulence factor [bacterium]